MHFNQIFQLQNAKRQSLEYIITLFLNVLSIEKVSFFTSNTKYMMAHESTYKYNCI